MSRAHEKEGEYNCIRDGIWWMDRLGPQGEWLHESSYRCQRPATRGSAGPPPRVCWLGLRGASGLTTDRPRKPPSDPDPWVTTQPIQIPRFFHLLSTFHCVQLDR